MTLGELIDALGGKLAQGDSGQPVSGVNSVERAVASELVFAEDAASAAGALASHAGIVVLRSGSTGNYPPTKSVVEASQPRLWFAQAGKILGRKPHTAGIHPMAVVAADVVRGADVTIGPGAVVGEYVSIGAGTTVDAGAVIGRWIRIGEQCHIYPRAVLYPGTTLGNRVIVHAGAVLGADGFGYVRDNATGASPNSRNKARW